MTIYKYTHAVTDDVVIKLPRGAKVIKIGMQQGMLTFWAIVDPDTEHAKVRFRVFGTGETLPATVVNSPHWGFYETVFDGPFVWHVFGPPEYAYAEDCNRPQSVGLGVSE